MNVKGLDTSGNWYKGNLHSHSTVSDGMLEPHEAVALYRQAGYHFLCLSEHDIYTDHRSAFNGNDFIILPGIEYSAILYRAKGTNERYKVHHMHGILGTSKMQEEAPEHFTHLQYVPPLKFFGTWEGQEAANRMSDLLRRHGCIVTYNHPIWSRVEDRDFTETRGLTAIEVFNFNTVQESTTGYDEVWWDTLLRRGVKINGFASDDNHNEGAFEDSCGGWIMVNAPELTHDAILQAFIDGNYYSSSGPEITAWDVQDNVACIRCNGADKITFVAGNIINDGTAVLGRPGSNELQTGSYRLKGHECYVRAVVTDSCGRSAWTNPIYLTWD